MTDDIDPSDPFQGEFNPVAFFEMLRKQASIKVGAVMFGEAQTAYYNTIRKDMGDEAAYNLLAHTTGEIIRMIPNLVSIAVRAYQVQDSIEKVMVKLVDEEKGGKEVPGQ